MAEFCPYSSSSETTEDGVGSSDINTYHGLDNTPRTNLLKNMPPVKEKNSSGPGQVKLLRLTEQIFVLPRNSLQ